MGISWFDTYTFLSYFSIAGITAALIAMVCIFGFCINLFTKQKADNSPINYFDLGGMMGYIGVAMFTFEGHAVIMNVRAETKNKHQYPLLLKLSILFCVIVFIAFASLCYLTFRDNTKDIVTYNL